MIKNTNQMRVTKTKHLPNRGDTVRLSQSGVKIVWEGNPTRVLSKHNYEPRDYFYKDVELIKRNKV